MATDKGQRKRTQGEKKAAAKAGRRTGAATKLIEQAITQFEDRLEKKDIKGNFGDFIRLLQMKQETEPKPKQQEEIRAAWVEPEESTGR